MNTENSASSRRSFFAVGAALVGGGIAARAVLAQTTTPAMVTDLDVLQYALALEHLEAAFYVEGLGKLTANDFLTAPFAQPFNAAITGKVYDYLRDIRDHEVAHVAALQAAIRANGGTPRGPCTYMFPYTTAEEFIKIAAVLENTGVSAYDGAIRFIKNPDLLQASATIATVEARHAAYLNLLNAMNPFPRAFDETKTMAEVLAAIAPFQSNCPAVPANPSTSNANGPVVSISPGTRTTNERELFLDASGSRSITGQAVSFSFTQVSGPRAAVNGGTTSQPSIQFLGGPGTYVFMITATDLQGRTNSQTVTYTYRGA